MHMCKEKVSSDYLIGILIRIQKLVQLHICDNRLIESLTCNPFHPMSKELTFMSYEMELFHGPQYDIIIFQNQIDLS